MHIGRETDYALRIILYLVAQGPGAKVSAGRIAERMSVPERFNLKILRKLSMKGIVQSSRGIYGGFSLCRSPEELTLLEAIEAQAAKLELVQDILLEVNIGGEASKSGISPEELSALAAQAVGSPHVRLRGLMAIPPVAAGPDGNRPFFAKMRQLYVDIRSQMDDNKTSFDCLSMGMSGDFEDAVREGATLVRVGTALFGPRPPMHKG